MKYEKIIEIEKESLTIGFTTDKDCWTNPVIKDMEEENAS